jgi:DNA polymerase V
MMTLGDMSPEVEVYSVDEAFLCLKGMRPEQLDSFGLHIKKRVELLTGIPVSLGIAPTKTLAKVANNLAKKRPELGGVLSVMDREKQDWALRQIPVGDIWGIGRKKAQRLEMMNIRRGIELRDFKNDRFIQKEFTKVSRMTVDELRGISCFDLELEPSKKKEIISSRTFGQPVYELKSLKESIASYASLACEKLRLQDSVCSEVEIWIRTNPHKNVEQYYALESFRFLCPTSDTCKVIEGAFEALKKIYRGGFEYKKALVKLKGIRDKSDYQLSLFEKFDSDQSEKLMLVMDKINQKDGRHTLKSAACGTDQKAWKMKQVLKSPRYVSGWSELPLVK